jgi:hypothetical protein
MVVSELFQEPPPVTSETVTLEPGHVMLLPVIGKGDEFTVMRVVTNVVPEV